MQAYYEIETLIPQDHQLQLQLPETIPAGRAKALSLPDISKPMRQVTASA